MFDGVASHGFASLILRFLSVFWFPQRYPPRLGTPRSVLVPRSGSPWGVGVLLTFLKRWPTFGRHCPNIFKHLATICQHLLINGRTLPKLGCRKHLPTFASIKLNMASILSKQSNLWSLFTAFGQNRQMILQDWPTLCQHWSTFCEIWPAANLW